jgi:hypothetical protein
MPRFGGCKGCVKNNFPAFLSNLPMELDGYVENAEVVFDTLAGELGRGTAAFFG